MINIILNEEFEFQTIALIDICVCFDSQFMLYFFFLSNNIVIQARREGEGTTILNLREDLTVNLTIRTWE
jgi:hypothetical protein